jgi:hypothetical protein
MECRHCHYQSDHPFKFCPECGSPTPGQNEETRLGEEKKPDTVPEKAEPIKQEVLKHQSMAYIRQDYDPNQDGRRYNPKAAPTDPVARHSDEQERPQTTGTIILSLVNMLCCGFGISMILGLIALVFAILASSERVIVEAEKKMGWAKTLNIIGLVFIVIQILVILAFIIGSIFFSSEGVQPFSNPNPGDFPLG